MTERTGWHCTACNRFGQAVGDELPDACPNCGSTGTLRRIEHPAPTVRVEVGDVVSCRIVGETETRLVGEVVGIRDGRVVVQADDGTGRYAVKPEQIADVRRPASGSGGVHRDE